MNIEQAIKWAEWVVKTSKRLGISTDDVERLEIDGVLTFVPPLEKQEHDFTERVAE